MKGEPITLNPRLAWREIEGRVVVISPDDSVVHELNETASFVWKHADYGRNLDEIALLISREFRIDVQRAKDDARDLLAGLARKGLLLN